MSRGLSNQQNSILGLAYTINRRRNGEFKLATGRRVEPREEDKLRIPVLYTDETAEITSRACLALLHDFSMKCVREFGGVRNWYFCHSRESKVAKASICRAITLLRKRDMLIWKPGSGHGYFLTAAGAEVGAKHEPPISDDKLSTTLGMLRWSNYSSGAY